MRPLAAAALTLLTALFAAAPTSAQTLPPFAVTPGCPAPGPSDGWPFAAADTVTLNGASVPFNGALLLANDTGTDLTLGSVGPMSSGAGTITGSGPYRYYPGPGYAGSDAFTYRITDSLGQTSVGVVKVVSGPIINVSVPDLTGSSEGDATSALSGAGLVVGPIDSAYSSSVAAGLVSGQSVPGGSLVPIGSTVGFTKSLGPEYIPPSVLATVSVDGSGRVTAPPLTTSAGALLVAFAASDGPPAVNEQSVTISGGGLTWTRVRRAASRYGVAEIWTATAAGPLAGVRISSKQAGGTTFHQSLTVVAFGGASGIGASKTAGGVHSAPSITLVPAGHASLVYAVGNDWDHAVPRALPAGQTMVHQFVDTSVNDTFWVQAASGSTSAGVPIMLNATAPSTDQWNLAVVEIKR